MKKIILHGYLKELHPEPICVEAETAAEAVSALRFYPGFNPDAGDRHSVRIPGFDSRDALYTKTDVEEIHLEPVMTGGGGGNRPGVLQIVIGAILIIAAFHVGITTPWGKFLAEVGASMILGGVISMLAPSPSGGGSSPGSRILGASQNTVKIGTPIPMMIGRIKHFGHYVSFNVDAVDYNGLDTDDPLATKFAKWLLLTTSQNTQQNDPYSGWEVVT